jgi:hypothetical protein
VAVARATGSAVAVGPAAAKKAAEAKQVAAVSTLAAARAEAVLGLHVHGDAPGVASEPANPTLMAGLQSLVISSNRAGCRKRTVA